MAEAGLKYNSGAIEFSRTVKAGDLIGIKSFLERNNAATAVLSMNVEVSHKIVEYADLVGMDIPKDLSLASLQLGGLRGKEGVDITGACYDWNAIMRNCTDILFGKFPYETGKVSKILHTPIIKKGVTVGAPRNGKARV